MVRSLSTLDDVSNVCTDFFASKGFVRQVRYPMVHPAFKTSFVLSAGVLDMLDYLEGKQTPRNSRSLIIQPCFRQFDSCRLDDGLHLSLFVMAGGLFFDKSDRSEVLGIATQLLTNAFDLDSSTLRLTYFGGGELDGRTLEPDLNTRSAWKRLGFAEDSVFAGSTSENFWAEGAPSGERRSGVCGPCAELFIDRGYGKRSCTIQPCRPGCACGRYVEVCNQVFPQYRQADGLVSLSDPSISEIAVGLERVQMIAGNAANLFSIHEIAVLRSEVLSLVDVSSVETSCIDTLIDHCRAFIALFCEGGRPAGKGRGHVMRRLLRETIDVLGCSDNSIGIIREIFQRVIEHPNTIPLIDVRPWVVSLTACLENEYRLYMRLENRSDRR